MRKGVGFFAGGLASLAMLGGAQAKMVRYEINGQRYSYDTNNRQQVEEARRRIPAANAAYAARLKADAERGSNPSPQCWDPPSSARPRKRWPVSGRSCRLRRRRSRLLDRRPAALRAVGRRFGLGAAELLPTGPIAHLRDAF